MSVNVLDGNGNLKKIAHGFPESKFNVLRSDIIENIELTDTASKNYAVGDYLIMANGQLVKVINAISEDSVITSNDVQATTVEEMIAAKADPADIPDVSKYQKIFTGTMAEWNQLTTEQKTAYDLANITDDLGTEADIVDAVTDGDMRAVTSNAVHDALESKISTSETTGLVRNDGSIDTKSYAEKVANGTENNLAGLDENGNLKDGGWSSDKTTTHVSGNPISISGLKSNQLAINPIITFEPIQAGSGTPSPSNIRAISGYDKIEVLSCGKNLFDSDQLLQASGWTKSNGVYSGSIHDLVAKFGSDGLNIPKFKENTQYTISYYGWLTDASVNRNFRFVFNYTDGASSQAGYNNFTNKTYISATSTSGKTIKSIGVNYGSSTTMYLQDIQFEEGASATTYEPCNKTTDLSESLGQTVYGGSLDLRSGKFTVSWIKEVIDNNTAVLSGNFSGGGIVQYLKNEMKQNAQIISDKLSSNTSDSLYVRPYYENANRIMIVGVKSVLGINSLTEWATYLSSNPITVCYELATPFTIQLTPHEISLLKDYAYVSANGTNIAFDYHNGELASLSDVVQVGETVNELGSNLNAYITKNSFGQLVDIKSYTASNMFTFPTDGYLYIRCNASGSKIFVIVTGSNANVGVYIELEYGTQATSTSLYVKKGMKAYVNSGTGNYSCAFVRLV